MAFRIEKDCKPIIARKNIVCYKALFRVNENEYKSNLDFYYEIGRLYFIHSGDFNRGHKRNYEIGRGFHSFINIPNPKDWNQHLAEYYGDTLLECIIPKGAVYFVNNLENHCVSNAIRLVRKIKNIKIESLW